MSDKSLELRRRTQIRNLVGKMDAEEVIGRILDLGYRIECSEGIRHDRQRWSQQSTSCEVRLYPEDPHGKPGDEAPLHLKINHGRREVSLRGALVLLLDPDEE